MSVIYLPVYRRICYNNSQGKRSRRMSVRDMNKEEIGEALVRAQSPDRRKRINRLKKIIVVGVACAILIPIILCIILLIRVNRLEQKIEKLEAAKEHILVAEQVSEEHLAVVQPEVDLIEEHQMQEPEEVQADEAQAQLPVEDETDAGEDAAFHEDGTESEMMPETSVDDKMRRVYLTFDDGPSSQTEHILEVLAEYDVKATFFVVGKTDSRSIEMYQRIVEEGHTLAMHSYSHEYDEIYASTAAFREDLYKLRDYLYGITGVTCNIYRFPGGSSNQVSRVDIQELIAVLQQEGISYFDWNISSQDASARLLSVQEIITNCTLQLENHENAVILLHDAAGKTTTVEALPILIEEILSMEDTVLLPITEETVPVQHRKPEE